MEGSQEDILWREAFVNLESSKRIYQIRFVHILPDTECKSNTKPCVTCGIGKCQAANVAISGIRMDCQGENKQVPLEMCKRREVPLSGCEIYADMPYEKGWLVDIIMLSIAVN